MNPLDGLVDRTNRISRDMAYMMTAYTMSLRATCYRRRVGCVLVNDIGHVLATGYNGVPAGMSHCSQDESARCSGWDAPSGQSLDMCRALHAEQNALMQCRDVWDIHTCYCTAFPCTTCLKLLRNTSCSRIVYCEDYPNDMAEMVWDRDFEKLDLTGI